jgi:hypothetical protein
VQGLLTRRGLGYQGDFRPAYRCGQVFRCTPRERSDAGRQSRARREASNRMSILWIILIVILVLALLGFFSRGRW